MNVIFLDIDGVLVTERHWVQSDSYIGMAFDPICVSNLKDIIDETKCKLVISSSWRESRTMDELIEIFDVYGIRDVIIGVTPVLDFVFHRGDEINAYLNENMEIEHFLIIDDEAEVGDLEKQTIRTQFYDGITNSLKNKIISFFKK